MNMVGMILLGIAVIFAFICGFEIFKALDLSFRMQSQRAHVISETVKRSGEKQAVKSERKSWFDNQVITYAQALSQAIVLGRAKAIAPKILVNSAKNRLEKIRLLAGFGDKITAEGFSETQVRLSIIFAIVGLSIGLIFSVPLAFLLMLAGFIVGFQAPMYVAKKLAIARASEVERHLPEMLDVLALCMRSGMSLDSSLYLYEKHFNTTLAHELANSQQQWTSGLMLRDDSLRKIASSYDSIIFGRVVETIIRSVRYGSSMVESLERDGAEARSAYQAKRQERIAKAPVKMMIPTGVLILPAMLIMVLGPVLLELAGGGL